METKSSLNPLALVSASVRFLAQHGVGLSRGHKRHLTVPYAILKQPRIKEYGSVRVSPLMWICAIALVALLYVFFVNPFPRDQELIEHFQLHRSEIEQLVQQFRTFTPPTQPDGPYLQWDTVPETKATMDKIGVKRILEHGATWLPNPYSIETARLRDKLSKEERDYRAFRQYGALKIFMADERFDQRLFFDGWLQKGLYLIPEIPKIENGQIISPIDVGGRTFAQGRVLPSLDASRWECWNWKKGECAFRQLAPHWYVFLCKAY